MTKSWSSRRVESASAPCRADPRCAMDIQSEVLPRLADRFTGVQPHPHSRLPIIRPGMRSKRPLRGHGHGCQDHCPPASRPTCFIQLRNY